MLRACGLAALLALSLPATAGEMRLALQTCVRPAAYGRCLDKCEWKERRYEESGDCVIVPESEERSTCRAREVRTVHACITRCKADYCPQYSP